jgi:hypothetical protein
VFDIYTVSTSDVAISGEGFAFASGKGTPVGSIRRSSTAAENSLRYLEQGADPGTAY